jgi:hypothetical protein
MVPLRQRALASRVTPFLPFSFSRLFWFEFPHGNRRLPNSALLGVECRDKPDAKRRAFRSPCRGCRMEPKKQQAAPEDGLLEIQSMHYGTW